MSTTRPIVLTIAVRAPVAVPDAAVAELAGHALRFALLPVDLAHPGPDPDSVMVHAATVDEREDRFVRNIIARGENP